jgi:hypothetical protein
MGDDLLGRIGDALNTRPWYKLPRVLAMVQVLEIRNQLRRKNLHDTEEPPLVKQDAANVDAAARQGRPTARSTT